LYCLVKVLINFLKNLAVHIDKYNKVNIVVIGIAGVRVVVTVSLLLDTLGRFTISLPNEIWVEFWTPLTCDACVEFV
jgi:hypothetical protein